LFSTLLILTELYGSVKKICEFICGSGCLNCREKSVFTHNLLLKTGFYKKKHEKSEKTAKKTV